MARKIITIRRTDEYQVTKEYWEQVSNDIKDYLSRNYPVTNFSVQVETILKEKVRNNE